jgi:ribosomal protein L18E
MSGTPNLDRRRNEIRSKQLTMRNMLADPKGFLKRYYRRKKSTYKRKVARRVNQTKTNMDKVWFGRVQQGGKINKTKRLPKNNIPVVYQYYQ